MGKKILCPYHQDNTPSLHIYGEWAHCYVCQAHCLTSELNLPEYLAPTIRPEPTNVKERLKYIQGLPTKMIRGLQLPYDNSGYYVVYPVSEYYKRRNWEGKTRYIGPSGVKAPLYVCPGTASHLIICEGELNALSLYQALWGDYKIVSPGSASEMMRHIKSYLLYNKITIIADWDAAGAVHAGALRDHLLKARKTCRLILMTDDFNSILEKHGEEEVRARFEREIS